MAPEADISNDEYVAKLLAKDARDSSIRYSAIGLSAFLPQRPTTAAPKPNKRFLTNLLRETDNHNAALKKKEELEARMRLRGEKLAPSRSGHDSGPQYTGRERKRRRMQEPEERSRSRDRKRKSQRSRDSSDERASARRRDRHRRNGYSDSENSEREHHYKSRRHSHRDSYQRRRPRRGNGIGDSEGSDSDEYGSSRRKGSTHHRRRSMSRSRSPRDSKGRRHDHRRRHSRPSSRSPSRSRSPARGAITERNDSKRRSLQHGDQSHSASDSDPLESLVGPLPPGPKNLSVNDPPPVTSRGRGAFRPSASTMDSHFTSSYDPTVDVRPGSEDENEKEDWDMALEALRDRELWKKKGAERLRSAGFGEEEIKKWEDSGREKGVEDVKWTSKGEAREWDRGKVVETEGEKKGEVTLEAAWKRKDGGFMRNFKKALG